MDYSSVKHPHLQNHGVNGADIAHSEILVDFQLIRQERRKNHEEAVCPELLLD